MRRTLLVLALSAAFAPRAAAARGETAGERPLNPDRWTTLELDVNGMSPWKSDQVVYTPGSPTTDSRRQSLDAAASALALLPLTDAFTLTLGLGGDWSEVETANAGASGSSTDDSSLATYRGAGRWYFEDEGSARWRATQNPDRWPSLGLTLNGTALINHSAGNAAGNTFSDNSSNSQTLVVDTRLPVADEWTLLFGAGGVRSESLSKTTAAGNGTLTRTGSVTANAGARYYFVGRNFILHDGNQNPDMWTMVYLTASGTRSLYSRQTLPAGATRDPSSLSESVTAGARLPITDHASLSFSAETQYARSYAAPTGAASGVLTRTSTLTFNAGVRYFLF